MPVNIVFNPSIAFQIQGLLDDQFDSISTIDGEEDDDASGEDENQENVSNNEKVFSTPLIKSSPRIKKTVGSFGILAEKSFNRSFGDVPESCSKDMDETNDVRYLLDQNNHLSAECAKLESRLSVLSGDYEGLQFKYDQLEKEIHDKDREIIQLSGKFAASEMQIEAEADAKKEYARKFSLAESTIQSLQNQMSELSKSDCLVRIQSNHDTEIRRLKENHENEVFALREKIEDLVLTVDEKEAKIDELARELKLFKSRVSELQCKYISDAPKSSPSTSKNTALFESLQSVKKELESAMIGKQELRNQNEILKKQVAEFKNQNCDLSSILKEKDSLINDLRSEARKMKILNLDINEQMKSKEQKLNVKEDAADFRAKEIKQLERLLESAKKEIEELKSKNKKLIQRLDAARPAVNQQDMFTQKEVQKIVKEATEEWQKSIQANFEELYMKKVKELEMCYENSQKRVVNDTRSQMKEQFDRSVEMLCSWIKGLVGSGVKPSNEVLCDVLQPVRDLWSQVENSFKTHADNLIEKRDEAEKAIRELELAYVSSLDKSNQNRKSLHAELEEVNRKLDEQGEKLKKYKIMCKDLQMRKTKEIERLKTEFAELLKNKRQHFELRENKLRDSLISQWNEKCRIIDQAFTDALNDVKSEYS